VSKKNASKIYLAVFATTAVILAWGVWFNYRPQVIYAGCLDIADKTQSIRTRYNLENGTNDSDDVLHSCLQDSGYYNY
jgi:hypothetical protein